MKKHLFLIITISLGVVVLITGAFVIKSIKNTSGKKLSVKNIDSKNVSYESNQEEKSSETTLPCLCNDKDLSFHHAIPDVCLNSEGQKEITIPLDYGYEVRWCCYNGTVSQYIDHKSKTMTLRRTTGEPTLQIRYYVLKK